MRLLSLQLNHCSFHPLPDQSARLDVTGGCNQSLTVTFGRCACPAVLLARDNLIVPKLAASGSGAVA